jgi:hypothetical protein
MAGTCGLITNQTYGDRRYILPFPSVSDKLKKVEIASKKRLKTDKEENEK